MAMLPISFYSRDTIVVAQELLGKVLQHETSDIILSGIIVETEAYLGSEDPASHAYRGQTQRNSPMFDASGRAYVYFIYGNHYCFNVVAHHQGTAGAILIRALEPVDGIHLMKQFRAVKDKKTLTNGPGKLTQAMGITKKNNGQFLTSGNLCVINGSKYLNNINVVATPRIGIKKGTESLYRFIITDNPYISKRPGIRNPKKQQ